MDSALYIKAFQNEREKSNGQFEINLESLITIFIYEISAIDKVKFKIKVLNEKPADAVIKVDFSHLNYEILLIEPNKTTYCTWPIILIQDKNIISGLCSVARKLIKYSEKDHVKKLLGFREACLNTCCETSIWTRFCEIDFIKTTKLLLQSPENHVTAFNFKLPKDVARFEYHMKQPVRIHNVYKVARQNNNNKNIKSSVPIEKLNLNHTFGEGPFMTLADIILFPCFEIFFNMLPCELIKLKIPLIFSWYSKMKNSSLPELKITLPETKVDILNVIEPEFIKQSLYTADPTRYRPEKRIYTKQADIDRSLKVVDNLKEPVVNNFLPYGYEINFNWQDIPRIANPNGGALPEKRADRKCEQLENLVKAVVKLTGKKSYKIVDFCSGSGHLGILLAYLLPTCEIILVDNKEQSLARARDRINKMELKNVIIVQSNLDYFVGNFDVGVSLHACGVATDLVIENCIKNRAHFVSCPCCYGGIRECHLLKYPRSEQFKSLNMGCNYFNLAHAADQTHDSDNSKTKQGFLCMDIIDSDRKLNAESCGYDVFLGKLQPATCTNKNNLLVGVLKSK